MRGVRKIRSVRDVRKGYLFGGIAPPPFSSDLELDYASREDSTLTDTIAGDTADIVGGLTTRLDGAEWLEVESEITLMLNTVFTFDFAFTIENFSTGGILVAGVENDDYVFLLESKGIRIKNVGVTQDDIDGIIDPLQPIQYIRFSSNGTQLTITNLITLTTETITPNSDYIKIKYVGKRVSGNNLVGNLILADINGADIFYFNNLKNSVDGSSLINNGGVFQLLNENSLQSTLIALNDGFSEISSIFSEPTIPHTTLDTKWYRPSGSPYGTGSGIDYDNAISGINNVLVSAGSLVYIRGTHNEDLVIRGSGTEDNYILYDFGEVGETDIGYLDLLDTETTGIFAASRDYWAVTNARITKPTDSCVYIYGTSHHIIFKDSEFSYSGNQGTQLLDTANNVIYWNTETHHNTDDGHSQHDSTEATYINSDIHDNDQGINIIESCVATVYNSTLYDNTTYDIWLTAADGVDSCVLSGVDVTYEKTPTVNTNCILNIYSGGDQIIKPEYNIPVNYSEYPADKLYNLIECYVNLNPTASSDTKFDQVDRSNTTVFSAVGRGAEYDATRPSLFRIGKGLNELNYDVLQTYYNTAYKDRAFLGLQTNYGTVLNSFRFFTYATVKAPEDLYTVLDYCNYFYSGHEAQVDESGDLLLDENDNLILG